MKAALVLHEKFRHAAGVVELMVWQVPEPVPPSLHGFKYRLVYAVNGTRVVGYDNERGKGDHKHLLGEEMKYTFKDVATLLADFWNDVEAAQ
ncbi:MAG: DUF6516 family protein [Rudaea sp.]|uniref:toxin-antitoxin system TumE family protein n=1 Tax=Rudaea sp. TaxID=2136325 RepID=UPI0039E3B4EC